MKTYVDQPIYSLGRIEGDIVRKSNPIRPAKPGETILTFGKYSGYPMEYVNEFDHSYIVFLSTLVTYGNPKMQPFVTRSLELTTLEERNIKRENKKYIVKKHMEIKWLTDFLKEVSQSGTSWSKFAYSVLRRLWTQDRLDLLTNKQVVCIANMWGEVHSGKKEGREFDRAREEFKETMKPYWKRKYERIEDL